MLYDLILIGAGAAGLFAAANAEPGRRVLLLEKTDQPGRKLLLTGSGQCNLTNTGDISAFLSRYGLQGKRLRPVLYPFSNLALMAWLEEQGLPLTIRSDGKVFPASLRAHDVLHLLQTRGRQNGVEFRPGTPVTALTPIDDVTSGARFRLETPQGPLTAPDAFSFPPAGRPILTPALTGAFSTVWTLWGLRSHPAVRHWPRSMSTTTPMAISPASPSRTAPLSLRPQQSQFAPPGVCS